jgi:hypothetical protein
MAVHPTMADSNLTSRSGVGHYQKTGSKRGRASIACKNCRARRTKVGCYGQEYLISAVGNSDEKSTSVSFKSPTYSVTIVDRVT